MAALVCRIPLEWRIRAALGVVSFVVGVVITRVWNPITLLVLLLIFSILAAIFRHSGVRVGIAEGVEKWALGSMWGRVRDVIIGAMLPTLWTVVRMATGKPSPHALLQLWLTLFLIFLVWDGFRYLPTMWLKNAVEIKEGKVNRRRKTTPKGD